MLGVHSLSVMMSVAEKKMGVFLRQDWNESQWTVHKWDILLSQQILAAIKLVACGMFVLHHSAALPWCIARAQQREAASFLLSYAPRRPELNPIYYKI